MNVVRDPANFDGLHFVLPGNAAHNRPEPVAQSRGDERAALLGAKHTMEIGTHVRHALHSAVRGLVPCGIYPALKRRAILITSLRDNSEFAKAIRLTPPSPRSRRRGFSTRSRECGPTCERAGRRGNT